MEKNDNTRTYTSDPQEQAKSYFDPRIQERMKAIITAYGINRIGILAEITSKVADLELDIIDISQKIMDNYFTMIMLVDFHSTDVTILTAADEFKTLGEKLRLQIDIQHEDFFHAMNRI